MPKYDRPAREQRRDERAVERRARRSGSGTPLTRERIVQTALAMVDRNGLRSLSMRRLGAELGVDPMAVYYYVPNKEALFDAIVEAVMAEIDLSKDDPSAQPEERVLWAARAYRDVMLAHVNALPIVLTRGPSTPAAMRPVELLIGIFRDAGLPPARAMAAMNAVAATVRGLVGMLAESPEPPTAEELEAMAARFPAEEFPRLKEIVDRAGELEGLDADFEFGIRALARGLIESAGGERS